MATITKKQFRFKDLYKKTRGKKRPLPFNVQPGGKTAKPDSLDLLEWINCYLRREVIGVESTHTARAKLYDLHKFLVYFHHIHPEGDIKFWDKALTASFVEALEKEYEVSTVYRIYKTISNFSNFLIVTRTIYADESPVRGIKLPEQELPPPKGVQVISNERLEAPYFKSEDMFEILLKTAYSFARNTDRKNSRACPFRDIAIISVLYHTGLRADELCSLTMSQMDIYSKSGGCWFRGVKCKGKRIRKVYLKAEGLQHLMDYIKYERGEDSGFIFLSWRGNRLSQVDIWRIVKRITDRASINLSEKHKESLKIVAHPHSFRHERGYNLKRSKQGDAFIAEHLGHADTNQVRRYSRRSEDDEVEILEEI